MSSPISEQERRPGKKKYEYDGVIIGGGHNALITAGYLGKAGYDVVVLENLPNIGGGLGTAMNPQHQEYYHELHSFFHRDITNTPWWEDLNVAEHGIEYIYPAVNNGMPLRDGRNLIIHRDPEQTKKSLAKFNEEDAETYVEVYEKYSELAEKIWFAQLYSPPIPEEEHQRLLKKSELGQEYLEINERSAYDVTMDLFENKHIRAMFLYMCALRGFFPGPDVTGTGFAVPAMTFHGNRALIAKGGSRTLAHALGSVVSANGGHIHTTQRVTNILIQDGIAAGVETKDGTRYMANEFVISGVDPTQTFLKFVGRDNLAESFVNQVEDFKYGTEGNPVQGTMSIHLALDEPIDYAGEKDASKINQACNIGLGWDTPEDVLESYRDIRDGKLPGKIGGQSAVPTVHDPTRAPEGKHTAFLWNYAPSEVDKGWENVKHEYANEILEEWGKYASNIGPDHDNIEFSFIQTNRDIERKLLNMRKGDWSVGSMIPEQMGVNRPFPEVSDYTTMIGNLYLTGASTHPGGSINGAPGYNTARAVLEDKGEPLWWDPIDARTIYENLQ